MESPFLVKRQHRCGCGNYKKLCAASVFADAGAFALANCGRTITATCSELGLRSDKFYPVSDAILTLRGRAARAHDYKTDRSASAELRWIDGWSIAGTFEGEFSDVTESYAGKGVCVTLGEERRNMPLLAQSERLSMR